MTTKHGHEEIITLNVTPVRKHNIIPGLPWCTFHQVQFDWNWSDITLWSPNCEGQCFHTPQIVAPLLVQLLAENTVPPTQATEGSIRYNLTSITNITIPNGNRTCIPTGIAIQLPERMYG